MNNQLLSQETKKLLTHAKTVNGSITVGTSSVKVMSHNLERKLATIVNDSANTIWLALGETAAVNKGIRLNALGGAFELGEFTNYKYFGAISAISDTANSNLTFVEI